MGLKSLIERIFGVKQEEQQVRCFSVGPERLAEILASQQEVLAAIEKARKEVNA